MVTIGTTEKTREIAMRYRDVWAKLGKPESALPRIGVSKHIVVADTDEEAKAIAARAYRLWRKHFFLLADRFGYKLNSAAIYPEEWAGLEACNNGFAGSPDSVRAFLAVQAATGINYFVSWLAFGDLTLHESMHSLDLYAKHVMPHSATLQRRQATSARHQRHPERSRGTATKLDDRGCPSTALGMTRGAPLRGGLLGYMGGENR